MAENDSSARITVIGLEPGLWHFYRFVAPGRNPTLPTGPPASFRMAVFSCSNLPHGFFNTWATLPRATTSIAPCFWAIPSTSVSAASIRA